MQKLYEYQKLDMEKKKIEQEILDCVERKNAKDMQNKLKEYQSKIFSLEEKAGIVLSKYEESLKTLDKYTKELSGKENNVAKINDNSIETEINALKRIKDNLNKIEREINELQKLQEQILKDNSFVMKNAVIANKNLLVYKERYNEVKANKEPEIREIEKKMEKLSQNIDAKLLAKYKQISETKPLPVFVPLKNGGCSGCRMEMPIAAINALKQKGFIECENCGRIIYFHDEK